VVYLSIRENAKNPEWQQWIGRRGVGLFSSGERPVELGKGGGGSMDSTFLTTPYELY
jgi:hypothetical protein